MRNACKTHWVGVAVGVGGRGEGLLQGLESAIWAKEGETHAGLQSVVPLGLRVAVCTSAN